MEGYTTKISLMVHLLVLLLQLSCFRCVTADLVSKIDKDRNTLNALKEAFNNPTLNDRWTTGHHCSWYGVRCIRDRVTEVTLRGIGLSGRTDRDALANLTELTKVDLSSNSVSGNMFDLYFNPKMRYLDLSENVFRGSISASLLGLNFLEYLHLQHNYFSGSMIALTQKSLRAFNVSKNNLSGRIPPTPALLSFNESSYAKNPGLCGPPKLVISCHDGTDSMNVTNSLDPEKSKRPKLNTAMLIVIIGLSILAVLVVLLFLIFYKRRKRINIEASKKECESQHTNDNKTEGEESASSRRSLSFIGDYKSGDFDIKDLLRASAEGLGKGSFGNCYKVTLDDGRTLVVKRLRNLLPLTSDEFARHMSSLADAKHPNLLPLLGYFFSDDEKLLVSRFAPNRSLFERIHGGRGRNRVPFKWNTRLSIARGVARALLFLHSNANPSETAPHGNLKTSNILLGDDGTPLVSDYGLRPLVSTTIAVRTMTSYKSPEYEHCRRVGHKSDVWSYGCVLLEIITGRMSSHSAPEGVRGIELCGWVNRAVREEWTGEVFDVEIRAERGAMGGVLRLLNVALRCCERVPEKRPEMAEVLREIEGIEMTASDDDDDAGGGGDSQDRSFESVEGQRSNAGLASVNEER